MANMQLPKLLQGAATVKALMPEAVLVFVAAESQAKLVERLAARKTETAVSGHRESGLSSKLLLSSLFLTGLPAHEQDKMLVRVQTAQHEMEQMRAFDYGKNKL